MGRVNERLVNEHTGTESDDRADARVSAVAADPVARTLAAELAAIPGVRTLERSALAEHTTLRVGGRPRLMVAADTPEAVARAVALLDTAGAATLVLGGGSNLVVAGGELDLVALAVRNIGMEYADDAHGTYVRAGAGMVWDDLVAATVAGGYGGLECLSGVPGSVGATPVQNVGAYGVEIAQLLRRVRLYDRRDGRDRWVEPDELGLGYRTSVLKNTDDAVVLEVELRLRGDGDSEPIRYAELARTLGVPTGERAAAASVRSTVLELRAGKGMVLDPGDHDTWSAGSFFTNPVIGAEQLDRVRGRVADRVGAELAAAMPVFAADGGVKLSAGWLIEKAGFGKGFPGDDAPARLSTKHTLALTNRGSADAEDVIALARRVRDGVEQTFGVRLHPEPVWVGCSI